MNQILSGIIIYTILGTLYFVTVPLVNIFSNGIISDAPGLNPTQTSSFSTFIANNNYIYQTIFAFLAFIVFIYIFVWPWYSQPDSYSI